MKYFEALKLLFPRSRAFELFISSVKRKIVKAFSVIPEDIRHNAELVYMDLFPDTTRVPENWEKTFAVYFTSHELEKRRAIIDSLWKINNGGQSSVFLQDILRNVNDNIQVVENIPVGDPRHSNAVVTSVNNYKRMVCGNKTAVNSYILGEIDYIPYVLQNDVMKLYNISDDKKYWETLFYICKSVVRNPKTNVIVYVQKIEIDAVWKNYIEYLILKIKPVHTRAILFIEWI